MTEAERKKRAEQADADWNPAWDGDPLSEEAVDGMIAWMGKYAPNGPMDLEALYTPRAS